MSFILVTSLDHSQQKKYLLLFSHNEFKQVVVMELDGYWMVRAEM
jgi:hypothetical protein